MGSTQTAILNQLAYCKVKVSRPTRRVYTNLPEYVELTAIEACEKAETVPIGEKPILWRLLTTHQVNDVSTAILMVPWYKTRWLIEELFRLLKHKDVVDNSPDGRLERI